MLVKKNQLKKLKLLSNVGFANFCLDDNFTVYIVDINEKQEIVKILTFIHQKQFKKVKVFII